METNEKTKKNGILKASIISILMVSIIALIGFAYARYITKLNGQVQGQMARYNVVIKVDGNTNQNFKVDLADTRQNDTNSVESGYVAPGTSGSFDIDIDASGADTSVAYCINFNTIQIPNNLHFYIDEDMKNEIVPESNSIELNGYIGYTEQNKTQTQTIYWAWPYESGTTPEEMLANDEDDSQWIGEDILLNVAVVGSQGKSGTVAVTFDENYFEEDMWSENKLTAYTNNVITTKSYEILENENAKYGKTVRLTFNGNSGTRYRGVFMIDSRLTAGKTYTWSIYLKTNSNRMLQIGYERGGLDNVSVSANWRRYTKTFVATSNGGSGFVLYNDGEIWNDDDILELHSQELIEGTPTYRTSNIEKNSQIGTIPTPTRSGYTFLGWYTDPVEGTRVTANTIISQDTTVYAHWSYNN